VALGFLVNHNRALLLALKIKKIIICKYFIFKKQEMPL